MANMTTDEDYDRFSTHPGFTHRSLSPNSFERLRNENSDYFYKPKRGPSASKSNITITRPIKHVELVNKLVDLLSKTNNPHPPSSSTASITTMPETKKIEERESTSTFLSIDDPDLSYSKSSPFSSRSHSSSISTVAEPTPSIKDEREIASPISCHTPAIGINITMQQIHLVLIELYPQNVDSSTLVFQRYLLSLLIKHEHERWSIGNVLLKRSLDQEANFRLFSVTREEFDRILLHLQSFINYNGSIASSFVLNIALTGEETKEYEMKIGSRLTKINLNFDLIPCRAESYMIGLDYFLSRSASHSAVVEEELIELSRPSKVSSTSSTAYPYILIHAEAGSTYFYIVHSSSQYSVISSSNLCYKTFLNLFKFFQPGDNADLSHRGYVPSFDTHSNDLCKHCHRLSASSRLLTSFTRVPSRYLPADYTRSKASQYIYRGWSNRRNSSTDPAQILFDVPTQTDDSFLEFSSISTRLAMHRSFLSMFTMNLAVIFQLIHQLCPTVEQCLLTGEFFDLEREAAKDFSVFLRSICDIRVYQLRRESLIGALGCALPRVYFDVINEHGVFGQDCIY